jgi:hypothetical protein
MEKNKTQTLKAVAGWYVFSPLTCVASQIVPSIKKNTFTLDCDSMRYLYEFVSIDPFYGKDSLKVNANIDTDCDSKIFTTRIAFRYEKDAYNFGLKEKILKRDGAFQTYKTISTEIESIYFRLGEIEGRGL